MRSDALDTSQSANACPSPPGALAFDAVNGWRGPGALAIAATHFALATDFVSLKSLEPIALLVDLFFVFSGFIIAKVYSVKLRDRAAIPEYLIRRLGRVWPVQAATLALLVTYELCKLAIHGISGRHFHAPAFAADGANLLHAIPTNLLLVHSLGIHDRETWNFPSWSVSVEFLTYGIFALFCLARPRLRLGAAAVTIAASLAILLLVAPYQMRSTFDYGIFRCLAGFFAGSLCYEALARWPLPRWPLPTLVELGTVAIVGTWIVLSTQTYFVFAAPIAYCALIVVFIPQRGLLSRILMLRPMQMLAELSFAIYMVHAVVLIFAMAAIHELARWGGFHPFISKMVPFKRYAQESAVLDFLHFDTTLGWSLALVGFMAAVLLTAYGAYRFIEVPGRIFFARIAKRTRLAEPLQVPASPTLPIEVVP